MWVTGIRDLVILVIWESSTAIHPMYRLNNTESMKSKLKSLNFNVPAKEGSRQGVGIWIEGFRMID